MNDFRSKIINLGKDGLSGLSDKFIKDDSIRGFTNQLINSTAQSLNDLNKNRLKDQSLNQNNVTQKDGSLNGGKKPGFWSKVGSFFKGLFTKNRGAVQGLIGRVPLVGGFANTLLDKFVPNSGNTAQSALNINNIPGPKGLSTGTE